MQHNLKLRLVTILTASLLVGTCMRAQSIASSAGSSGPLPSDPHAMEPRNEAAPTVKKTLPQFSQYTVGVADVLRVNVWKNPDLSQTVTVGPDGFVSLALLGDVRMVGMTTNQLAAMLTSKLDAYLVNPQVTVSVVEIRSRQVYVMGEVSKPGGYPLLGPMSVLQMIAQAGGLNTFANRKKIYVLRSFNGQTQRFPFNYSDVIRGKDDQNIALKPGDTVVVP